MALASQSVFDQVSNHARTMGLFQTVDTHEPKDAPEGVHCAFYVAGIRPHQPTSGLASTSAVITIMGRIYVNMLQDPQDAIDPQIVAATDKLIGNYHTDHTLGGNVMTIDLLGMAGTPLEARAGYINISGTNFRSMDLQIPCLVRDAWTQGS